MRTETTKMYSMDDSVEDRVKMVNSSLDDMVMSMRANRVPEFHISMYDRVLRPALVLIEEQGREADLNTAISGVVQTLGVIAANFSFNFSKELYNSPNVSTAEMIACVAKMAFTVSNGIKEVMKEGIAESLRNELNEAREAAGEEPCTCAECTAARAAQDPTSVH